MNAVTNLNTLKVISSLEELLENIARNNTQSGSRLGLKFYSSSLIKLFVSEAYFEGITYDPRYEHIHYRIHIGHDVPSIEILAGDPTVSFDVVENELPKLFISANEKFNRELRKKVALENGETLKTGGPGKYLSHIYIWSGDGEGTASLENFKQLIREKKVSEYFVRIAIKLNFQAVKYSVKKLKSRELF